MSYYDADDRLKYDRIRCFLSRNFSEIWKSWWYRWFGNYFRFDVLLALWVLLIRYSIGNWVFSCSVEDCRDGMQKFLMTLSVKHFRNSCETGIWREDVFVPWERILADLPSLVKLQQVFDTDPTDPIDFIELNSIHFAPLYQLN